MAGLMDIEVRLRTHACDVVSKNLERLIQCEDTLGGGLKPLVRNEDFEEKTIWSHF